MNTHEIEFCYRMRHPVSVGISAEPLPAPSLDSLEGAVLDPALNRVVVRVAPYANMASGDQLLLSWEGLDVEGFTYQHEMVRFVSDSQVGNDVIFVVKGMHIAALDGGSLEVYWTLVSAGLSEPLSSVRLALSVGDTPSQLLAAHVDGVIGGTLDPARVREGVLVTLQPYGRMAAGDRVSLICNNGTSPTPFTDTLKVEAFAVAQALSFWVAPEHFAVQPGSELTLHYRVEQACGEVRESTPATVRMIPFLRGELAAPDVLEAEDGLLLSEDAIDGATVVIGNAQTQEGELVYLKCDGDLFNHRDDREITRENAGKPLIFIVPHRFWREHLGGTVRVAYTVERLDDISQESAVTRVQVEA